MENLLHIVIIALLLYIVIRMERKSSKGCPCRYYRDFPNVDNRYYKTNAGPAPYMEDIEDVELPRQVYEEYATYRDF
jgi:hypothetical protein